MVEVLSEVTALDGFEEVDVGREHDAHVDLDRVVVPDAFEAALLQDAEQFDLEGGGCGADLIEEDRASVRAQELAESVGLRAREGAATVAEQFAFQRFSGSAPQFTSTNALLARGDAWWMARATRLLPVPLSPEIRTVARVAATVRQCLVHLAHAVVGADEVVELQRPAQLRLELLVLTRQVAAHQRALDREEHLLVDHRLGDVVLGAVTHRLDGGLDRSVPGEHDRHEVRVDLADLAQKSESIEGPAC